MKRHVEQLGALGQGDRLQIFRLLVRAGPEGKCVDEIKRRLGLPGSTLSHHLDTLARAGLLAARRAGRFIFYAVNWRETAALIRFLTEDCCAEMHLKLAPAASEVSGKNQSSRDSCCEENQPATANGVRGRRKTPEAQNG